MKRPFRLLSFLGLSAAAVLLLPRPCLAQKSGLVMCAPGSEATLYSSMVTLEIAATLKCGEPVAILGRYDNFFQVRTDKGQTGFIPAETVRFVKAAPAKSAAGSSSAPLTTLSVKSKGTKAAANGRKDNTPVAAEAKPAPRAIPATVTLANQTPVYLKVGRTISSADAKAGEEVKFEVTNDVVASGYTVIPKGAVAVGEVTQAEPKRRMGRSGKLSVSAKYVQLGNGEKVTLRSFEEQKSADQKVGKVVPFMKGKDITIEEGALVTAFVNGDVKVKTANLRAAKN
jgi:hypothetical protein